MEMQTLYYLEMNIFAVAILLIIYYNIAPRKEKHLFENKLFLAMLGCNIVILFFDSIMWIINGKHGFLFRETHLFATALYYVFNPVPCMLWSLYADYQIFRDKKRIRRISLPLMIPVFANGILSILSVFGNVMFYIDDNNVYHRGKLFLFMAVICYLYFMYTAIQIYFNRSKIKKKDYAPLITFAIPPFIGGIIQVLFYGISIIWISMSLSILMIFIKIQNNQLYTDHLTGLYNRRQLDNYLLGYLKRDLYQKKFIAGIMIDINSFKKINDLYGHVMGDQALEDTAKILTESFGEDDFIARYGGDEFIVILEIDDENEITDALNTINSNINSFNKKKNVPYNIDLSIGYAIYDFESGMTIREFLSHIDILMYQDKHKTM